MPQIINSRDSENNSTKNIKLFSTEVQEIISQTPNWIVRNGMVLFLAIIVTLLATTFFINYPDVVNANAALISVNAPKEIKAKTEGRLVKLFVKEGEQVEENKIIGFIESRAVHNEVISLSNLIDTLQAVTEKNTERLPYFITNSYKNLGEVQPYYQLFMQAFTTFRQYISSGYYLKRKNMLQGDIVFLQKLHANLGEQKTMQEEDLGLADKNFAASKSLSSDKVIADVEFRNEKSKLIAKAMTIPQINASLINNESSKHEKEKEIAQLENDIAQQKGIFLQALNTLKSQLSEWKNKYLLVASVSGKTIFNNFPEENMQLKQGQTVCFINPENTLYYASIFIPQKNFGKIKKGEKVILKLPAYPFQEFGTITGKLDFIAEIPTDSGFTAKVLLPNGLLTNYRRELQYHEGLSAKAEIITEDLKLSQRIFNWFYTVIKN
jgi:multidrug efflux pump subunit AcrA (membrane-fusion protein)